MKKTLLTFLLMLVGITTYAVDFTVDTILTPGPVEMNCHLRVLPRSRGKSSAILRWNVERNGDYHFARVNYDPSMATEEWDDDILLQIGSIIDGKEIVQSHRLKLDGDPQRLGFSLKLSLTPGGASVTSTVRRATEWFNVPFETEDTVRIEAIAAGVKEVLRFDLDALCPETPRYATFTDLEALYTYLSSSTDPYEGVWTHYDSDTNPRRTGLGGHYTVATVSRGDGVYDIIYLDGDVSWKALRVKGTLKPATFPGIYDLHWLQPSGVAVGDGCNAQFVDDLLTLSFPYWKATLRLRRLTISNK